MESESFKKMIILRFNLSTQNGTRFSIYQLNRFINLNFQELYNLWLAGKRARS